VISRVADHCFWFGRYLERSESTARLLQATRTLALDGTLPFTQCWQPLIIVSGQFPEFKERFGLDALGDGEVVQGYMTWDAKTPVSLKSCLGAARENARIVRDVLSLDTWEATNELYHFMEREPARKLYDQNRDEFYLSVRRGTQLALGLVRSTMLHDQPMNFLWLGVMLERAGQTARILDMHHHIMEIEGDEHDIMQTALWLSLLRACSGGEAFMRKHQGRISPQALVSFLVKDLTFPRSLAYCLKSAHRIVGDIWSNTATAEPGAASLRLGRLGEHLKESSASADGAHIHELLTHVVDQTALVCSDIGKEIQGLNSDAWFGVQAQSSTS